MILMRLVCRGSSRVRKVSESKSNDTHAFSMWRE